MLVLGIALLSGCATVATSNYCQIYSPSYFESEAVIQFLGENDKALLRNIVTQNETYAKLCK